VLNALAALNEKDITFNIDNMYLMYKRGFLSCVFKGP